MTKKTLLCSAIALTILGASTIQAGDGHHAHWGYEGHAGPEHWGELSENFATCSSGKQQSPIDIQSSAASNNLDNIVFNYQSISPEVLNNGHTIQANYAAGSGIEVNGKHYDLLQFHFHTPSENTVDGKPYNMEMHLVHKSKDGQLAVVGVFMKQGDQNDVLQKLWDNMPQKSGEKKQLQDVKLSALELLPTKRSYSHFAGSLTTPPCSEGVNWFVMDKPIELSAAQIKKFADTIGENARPTQPLNDRTIAKNM